MNTNLAPKDRIIVALDVDNLDDLRRLVRLLKDHVGLFKIGLELIHAFGPRAVDIVHGLGGRVMYDAKLADIPTTVGKAMRGIAARGVHTCTVFLPAGVESVTAAVENRGNTGIIGVTVLTSMDDNACAAVYNLPVKEAVLRLADQAMLAGCQGLVCSPHEIALIRGSAMFSNLRLITPGVRPSWAAANDQKRITTPKEAVRLGADYLVIGRPITQPPTGIANPVQAAQLIAEEIGEAHLETA